MATFAKATYNAAKYASVRPTYPRRLYDYIFQYHDSVPSAKWGTAVDLGCGTGQATTELTPFQRIIGVDPSSKMIEQATKDIQSAGMPGQLEYIESPAESLPFLEDGSVDLIVAAQAAHWFDWNKLWKEAARVLRTGGTLAVWGYSEFRLAGCPSATPLIHEYSQGSDPANSLGPHWERPGRTIVDNHLLDIPDPRTLAPEAFSDFQRIFFSGEHHPELPSPRPVILRKTMTWANLNEWLHTFSAIHTFHERYPDDLKQADGDIAARLVKNLKEQLARQRGDSQGLEDTDEVDIEWPLALLLAKRS